MVNKKNLIILVILILVLLFQINQLIEIRQENPNVTFVKQLQKLGISLKTEILQKGGGNETEKWK